LTSAEAQNQVKCRATYAD